MPALIAAASDEFQDSIWLSVGLALLYALPGALMGGIFGWYLTGYINAGLRWVFRGFNRLFDRLADVYGGTVARALRLSAVAMVGYALLLGYTYLNSAVRRPASYRNRTRIPVAQCAIA